MSSANRERRQRNRAARSAAVEESMRRARRQRITFAIVGLALALVVGIALVARATSGSGSSAASTTSTTAPTSTTVPAPKRCVAMQKPLPKDTPLVPVVVGKPPTKLVKRDLQVGEGAVVKPGDSLTVNYVGVVCSTGTVFGSSYGGEPQQIALKQTIPGWQRGIPGMRVGGERLLGIPPALGYGATGTPDGSVGPDETLWFLVQVVKDS